jgi:hypothetical protein
MNQDRGRKAPATSSEAVVLATQLLRFQVDLSRCRIETIKSDPFVSGYLWGFCAGCLSGLRGNSPGLFALHSVVCRGVFGDRDGASIVEHVARTMDAGGFREGERVGLADALRSLKEGRTAGGLIAHLSALGNPCAGPASGDDGSV